MSKDSWLNKSYREWARRNGESVPGKDFQVNFCKAFWNAMEISPGLTKKQFFAILAATIFLASFLIYGGGHATLEYSRKAANSIEDLFSGILADPLGVVTNIAQVVFIVAIFVFLITTFQYIIDYPNRKHRFAVGETAILFLNAVVALYLFLLGFPPPVNVLHGASVVPVFEVSAFLVIFTADFLAVTFLIPVLVLLIGKAISSLLWLLLQKGFVKTVALYSWSRVKNIKLCPTVTIEGD